MDDSVKMFNCLICSVPTNACHMGIDSCRACSVFYKRTLKLNNEWLKCKKGTNDCIGNKATTSCRKCRFQRFKDALAQSSNPTGLQYDETDSESDVEKEKEKREKSQPFTSFLDHDTFSLLPSSSTETPLLDRIKNGYSLMCVIRKTGEVPFIPAGFVATKEMIENNDMQFFPMTYSMMLPTGKINISALFDCGNATFADFRSLSNVEKCSVALASFQYILLLDCAYRSVRYFPECDTRCVAYMFTANDEGVEAFLDTCPNEINREEVASAFRKNAVKLTKVKEHLKRVAPSDSEFALLFGLCFWCNDVSNISDSMVLVVERNRKAIMDELHLLYKQQGRSDYAARLGELYCLLANLEEICTLAMADLELYRLMNIFNDLGPKN